jgi:hypothetical protein
MGQVVDQEPGVERLRSYLASVRCWVQTPIKKNLKMQFLCNPAMAFLYICLRRSEGLHPHTGPWTLTAALFGIAPNWKQLSCAAPGTKCASLPQNTTHSPGLCWVENVNTRLHMVWLHLQNISEMTKLWKWEQTHDCQGLWRRWGRKGRRLG